MNIIHQLFSLPVYQVDFENFDIVQDDLEKTILNKIKQESAMYDPNVITNKYSKDGSVVLRHPELETFDSGKILLDFIVQHANIFWKHLDYSSDQKVMLKTCWGVLNPPSGFVVSHYHLPNPIVGAFYVNASLDQGDIVFENPLETILGHQPYSKTFRGRMFDVHIPPKTGRLLLWPGFIKHRVEENKSNTNRLVISFDIGSKLKTA